MSHKCKKCGTYHPDFKLSVPAKEVVQGLGATAVTDFFLPADSKPDLESRRPSLHPRGTQPHQKGGFRKRKVSDFPHLRRHIRRKTLADL